MKSQFKPIENLSLVDRVEINLREYFEKNNMKPGDPIPKEIDIAADLQVSRTVVREALLRLRTLGIIESKKHRGMILTEPDILLNFGRVLNPRMLGVDALKDIFELRLILEVGMADLLFRNRNEKNLKELEEIISLGETRNSDQTTFTLRHEIQFHGKLYEISGNKTLLRFQSMLLPVFEYVTQNHFDGPFEYSNGFVTHRDLYGILRNETPEKFRNGMRRHLEPHFERIFKPKLK